MCYKSVDQAKMSQMASLSLFFCFGSKIAIIFSAVTLLENIRKKNLSESYIIGL